MPSYSGAGGTLLFSADEGTSGRELWTTGGTSTRHAACTKQHFGLGKAHLDTLTWTAAIRPQGVCRLVSHLI